MKSRSLGFPAALFLTFAIAQGAVFADSTFVTHLFPRQNGEAGANTGTNRDEWLEVGKSGSIAWITYVTSGANLSMTSGAKLTLYVDSVHSAGTLKLFALRSPVTAPEMIVDTADLDYVDTLPIDSISLSSSDQEKVVRLNLGNLLSEGAFYGLVLKGYDGLRVDLGAKDAPVQPLIELKYAYPTAGQINQAISAGAAAEAAASDAAAASASAGASASAASGSAGDAATSASGASASAGSAASSAAAASGSAASAASSATAASGSATAAAGSATAASGSATAASTAATAASGSAAAASASASSASASAGSASSSASSAASSASAAATSATAAAAAVPYGIAMLGLNFTPPTGFTNTGIKVNYEVPTPWTTGSSLASARQSTGYAVIGSKIYVSGGNTGSSVVNTFVSYDVSTNSWTTLASMPFNAQLHTLVLSDSILYTIGGLTTATGGGVINELHKYNPSTNSWSRLADAPFGRWAHAAAAVNGKIYVMGGYTSYSPANTTTTMHCYDIATNTWSTKASLPTARAYTAAIVLNGKIHVLGGGSYVDVHEVYDPSSNTWTSASALPSPRSDMRLALVNGKMYVLGGDNGSSLASNLQYDDDSNTWSTLSSMSTGRGSFAIGAVGDTVYAIGGYSRTSGTLSSTEKYSVPKSFYLILKNP